jgi:general secretion pathway protein A
MYCQFYALKERPFNVTSDPAFFFSSRAHQEALSHLHYGVNQRTGIIALTGEIGAGKTTICRFFINNLGRNNRTAFIFNPYFSELQLLEAIVKDFGIATRASTRLELVRELNLFLLIEASRGNNAILIIDEAQNLKPNILEQIRLLSNLETDKEKLLQVILVGQPELNDKLQLRELRQLRQRIMVRYHIAPLAKGEVFAYIQHRLSIAGAESGKVMFTDEALSAVADFSRGTPRLINMVCDRAMTAGFVSGAGVIDLKIVNACLDELSAHAASGISETVIA